MPDVLLAARNEQRSSNLLNEICNVVGRLEERLAAANQQVATWLNPTSNAEAISSKSAML